GFLAAADSAPEQVTIFTEVYEFINLAEERREMLAKEREWLGALDPETPPPVPLPGAGRGRIELLPSPLRGGAGGGVSSPAPPLEDLLKLPLYDYQLRGAIFAACRGRTVLGD